MWRAGLRWVVAPFAPASGDAPGPSRRRRGPRALAAAWLGRLVQWRIRRKGLDLSELTFLPEGARLPLLRNGTDPVPELAEPRGRCPVQRLDLAFGFSVHLVTGYEQARAVLADGDSYSNDMRHLFRNTFACLSVARKEAAAAVRNRNVPLLTVRRPQFCLAL